MKNVLIFLPLFFSKNLFALDKIYDVYPEEVRELYQSSNFGGYLYNNSDISLQIYGLDKQNANKNLNIKSNLGYIDLDTCTDKIYKDNHLSDNDKILVIKYDMLNFRTNNISFIKGFNIINII